MMLAGVLRTNRIPQLKQLLLNNNIIFLNHRSRGPMKMMMERRTRMCQALTILLIMPTYRYPRMSRIFLSISKDTNHKSWILTLN